MNNAQPLTGNLLMLFKRGTIVALSGLLAFLTLCPASPMDAQVATATVNGTVQDASGALVPGAEVVIVQAETNFTTHVVSSSQGEFNFPAIPVGHYVVHVTKPGFKSYEQSGIELQVGQIATLQVSMSLGEVTESVIVSSSLPLVDTTSPTIQDSVDSKTLVNIPLNGRNPADLMYTVAGTTNALLSPASTAANSTVQEGDATLSSESAPTTNGVRPGGTYFSLDGAGNVDPFNLNGGVFPNPDATQEFSVVTGTYGARYVSAPGGAVNIVTRSGTNQIHGTVFEFIRNGYFNARNYFSPGPDTLKRNQFGFAVGGPIVKDKLFIFGSYQQLIQRQPTVLNEFVGTAAERQGNFTSAITGATVTVPVSTVAGNLFKYIPAPNAYTPGTNVLDYYNTTIPGKYNEPQGVLRLDYYHGQHRLFARYLGDYISVPANPMLNNNALTATQGNHKSWETVAIGDTWSNKSGKWIVDTQFSGLRVRASNFNSNSLNNLNIVALGATGITAGSSPSMSVMYATDGFIVGAGANSHFPRKSWDYNLNVLHSAGKNELSFGTNFRAVSLNESNDSGENPAFVFVGITSTIFYGPLNDNPFADLVMGNPYEFVQSDGFFSNVSGKLFGVYAEDKYHLSSAITATAGLRWDPYFPFTPANGHIDCWIPGEQSKVFTNAPVGLVYPGDPGCNSGGTDSKYGLIQPRVGIAMKLDQSGSAALRAGYGLYATQAQLQSLIGFSAPPFVRSFAEIGNFFQSVDNPYGSNGTTDPFASGFHDTSYVPPSNVSFPTSTGFNISAIDPTYRPAYTEQWSLSLQKSFTHSDSIELAYVGTQSIHIGQTYDANLPVYGPGASQSNENQRRPYFSEGLEKISILRSNATGQYNGLNATYNHRGAGGLDLSSSFNWSKCLDEGSQPATTGAVTALGNNPRLLRGRCDFDQDLSFRSTLVWNSPTLKGHNRFVRTAIGSWIVSGLIVADSGFPFSVTDGGDYSYTGLQLDMADVVPGVSPTAGSTELRRLNYAAFTNNAPGTYGDSGRNSFRGPADIHFDPAVMKTFPLVTDRFHLTFRAEAFNVFNHPNFFAPNADYNSGATNFGTITGARDPRILQFALKLNF